MAGLSQPTLVCDAKRLRNGGAGVRFSVRIKGAVRPAFAVRYQNRVYAYINECAHRSVELDWNEGDFFDAEGRFLVCATHGARYHPQTGACTGGPCNGRALTALRVEETDGAVRLAASDETELVDT
jgi:nitrite reductase/ring-hydroxylating ferredoxin subunit